MTFEWSRLQERGSPFALRLIRWIAMNLGRPVARLFLYPITLYFFFKAKPQRRASYDYLSRALGHKAGVTDVLRHIFTFSATILDRVFLLTDRHSLFDIEINNEELLSKLREHQQGCLLLGSHLGSFEVMRTVGVKRFPVKVLMHVDHNENITRILEALNPGISDIVIPLGEPETLLRVKEAVDSGYFIGLLGDRVADNDAVVEVDFLGEKAGFPVGPMQLAYALKVPVIMFFGLYRGGNRYDIFFESLGESLSPLNSVPGKTPEDWVREYAKRLEYHTQNAPYNWFNFYDFWRQDRGSP
jgi:predicted LPLAT superfamily acyltransferase